MKSTKLWIQYLRWPVFIRMSVIVLMILILFGTMISYIEPKEFPTPFEGIWWALVTMSTTGYGDFVPKTFLGRTFGMILILTGVAFLTSYFTNLSAAAVKRQNAYIDGEIPFKGKNHFLLIGWNEKTKEIIEILRIIKFYCPIVLIDQTLSEAPYIDENIHFIKGNPADDQILNKANIKEAKAVFITADQHRNELEADMLTILVLITVKASNPSVYTICEMMTKTQTLNAKRAGADEIIQSFQVVGQVFLNSFLFQNGFSNVILELGKAYGARLTIESPTDQDIGKNFQQLHNDLFSNGIILFGIKRGEEIFLNPPHNFTVVQHDCLIALKN
ncbi:potassium channel protein [Aeribacillus pallidus]|uniref:potassium channel family protein n=1 Tax=Aeribacillus TaxID=1055323 RepID=UPI001023600E|nr:potassium channel family protein [Aeribacillus pallidus]RZI52018.1 potassium channel protein [Aeribacillus pallidus]